MCAIDDLFPCQEEGEGGLQAADRLPSGLSLDGAFSETGLSQLSLQETEDYEGDEGLEAEVPEWACACVYVWWSLYGVE